jgi:hypothetical protein
MRHARDVSGPEKPAAIRKTDLLLLRDYHCQGEEIHEQAIPVDAQLAPEQYK